MGLVRRRWVQLQASCDVTSARQIRFVSCRTGSDQCISRLVDASLKGVSRVRDYPRSLA